VRASTSQFIKSHTWQLMQGACVADVVR
jgi:hypothetical protein